LALLDFRTNPTKELTMNRPNCDFMQQWQYQIGARRSRPSAPRKIGALSYIFNGPILNSLIKVEHLCLAVLYDDRSGHQCGPIRLAGFTGGRVPRGVFWGGVERNLFYKDLSLPPSQNGNGRRLNPDCSGLLPLGLQLDRLIERRRRQRYCAIRRLLKLPRLWAAFNPENAGSIFPDGPELAATVSRSGQSADSVLEADRRTHMGLTLLPLVLVSHHWQQTVAVFADLDGFPKRQVFRIPRVPEDFQGQSGPAQFDFSANRFDVASGLAFPARDHSAAGILPPEGGSTGTYARPNRGVAAGRKEPREVAADFASTSDDCQRRSH
jgi:hypothetical protein